MASVRKSLSFTSSREQNVSARSQYGVTWQSDWTLEMLKLKKTIDFNLLGDESEAHMGGSGVMDLDDDLSEETSPSPPPLKLARINISHCSDLQSSPPCSTPLSRLGQFFSSPSPPQQGARTSRLFFKPLRKSISKLPDCKSSKVSGKSVGSVNRNPFTPGGHSHTLNRKRHFSR